MKQQSFSDIEYSMRKKTTKREEFLNIMEEIIPWDEWVEYIRPYYPSSKRGRFISAVSATRIISCVRCCPSASAFTTIYGAS